MNREINEGISPYKLQVGQCYKIYRARDNNWQKATHLMTIRYSSFECWCTFRYEGKKGIHYFFREVVGGWIRTFTFAQFIGNVIQEVSL